MSWVREEEVEKRIKEAVDEHKDTIKSLRDDNNRVVKDYESKERILRNELQLKIDEAIKDAKTLNQKLEQENAVIKTEVKILQKAFENMGFDVKDMKEILNKLVDGLIAKNEIKLVK